MQLCLQAPALLISRGKGGGCTSAIPPRASSPSRFAVAFGRSRPVEVLLYAVTILRYGPRERELFSISKVSGNLTSSFVPLKSHEGPRGSEKITLVCMRKCSEMMFGDTPEQRRALIAHDLSGSQP